MVRGLELFQNRFAKFVDQYVLIGGTAASLTMEQAGLDFRATKDLPLKAIAWMELTARKEQGDAVDAKAVRKPINLNCLRT